MPYNSQITRSDAEALIPEEYSREIIQELPQSSAVLSIARRLPNMSRGQQRLPVLGALAHAYFTGGDTGLKQTSKMEWGNKVINAEELAVIIPVPEAVIDDADYDIWSEVRPSIVEAFGLAVDRAILFGENAPGTWPDDILTGATAAGHAVAAGSGDDLYDDIMGEGGVIAHVEEDGYLVSGHVAALSLRAKLRALRDQEDRPLFVSTMQGATQYALDGAPVTFPTNGGFASDEALLISGDWSKLVYSIRQDVTWKLLDQAVIQDQAGDIIYNLAQQDMVALRATFRLGWQLPNPVNRVNPDEETRYPFAVLTPAVS